MRPTLAILVGMLLAGTALCLLLPRAPGCPAEVETTGEATSRDVTLAE